MDESLANSLLFRRVPLCSGSLALADAALARILHPCTPCVPHRALSCQALSRPVVLQLLRRSVSLVRAVQTRPGTPMSSAPRRRFVKGLRVLASARGRWSGRALPSAVPGRLRNDGGTFRLVHGQALRCILTTWPVIGLWARWVRATWCSLTPPSRQAPPTVRVCARCAHTLFRLVWGPNRK